MELFRKVYLPIFIPTVLLASLSFTVLLSLSPDFAKLQLIFILIGFVLYLGSSFFDYTLLKLYWKPLLALIIFFLLLTLLIGSTVRGSVRWINLGPFRFQPSEFAKIFLIISLGSFFSNIKDRISLKNLILALVVSGGLIFLVLIQPDLGTSLILIAISFFLLLQTRINKLYIFLVLAFVGIVSGPMWNGLKDYQKQRVLVFINPYADPLGAGYNVLQSRIAVGSGQFFGKGFGHGTQSKLRFLPEFHTDFIFASFAEEWGFLGVLLLLTLYALLLVNILKVVGLSSDPFGYYVSIGVFTMIVFQVFINIGMNLGIMPVTGIPLPLMSYGGSSIIATFISLGLVSSIARKSL